jgi:FKBP-type peptidyl-prolyl cis-trans isomerase
MLSLRIVGVAFALLAAPVLLHAQREKLPPDDLEFVEKQWPGALKSNGGIRYVIENPGKGPPVGSGDIVNVNYEGRLLSGKVFDRNHNPAKPFTFRVNRGLVIQGWDQILQLMPVGAKWIVIVPPELGYGRVGSPPRIPGNATLVFEIEILSVKREE